ncbi:hypothetical protein Y032_0008g259 [Ancylostoma ceylanicum]|uniref:Abnormal cell migration protein 18-like fibronectin type I domain-containing protein n=2 Tax=Ancylostoma ceylanicum TaxID=53326 RepID=A0A016VKH8_9BILA|nr:hypothetical protein Y032_0008g259 [Ancylostoma ceylanicum]
MPATCRSDRPAEEQTTSHQMVYEVKSIQEEGYDVHGIRRALAGPEGGHTCHLRWCVVGSDTVCSLTNLECAVVHAPSFCGSYIERYTLQMILIFLLICAVAHCQDKMVSSSSALHLIQNVSITEALESLPKECSKNGKKYKEGEEFTIGHLRYKCQKYGVYSIEGCITENKKNLNVGEVVVINNVKSQCLAVGDRVFYRETVCSILGQPECEKIGPPSGFEEATKKEMEKEKDKTQRKEVTVAGLPPGWKVLDESRREIPGTNGGHMITRTLVFSPIPGRSRARRQSGRGVGSVVAIEDVGTDKPSMPMSMLLNGGKKSSTSTNHPKGKPFSTQQVSSTLGIKGKSNERIVGVGTGSRDLHSRTPTISSAKGLKVPSSS